MSTEDRQTDPSSLDDCIELGEMSVDERSAELYACGDLVIACFSDPPGEVQAQHMYRLTFESDVFLVAAFRLYLDRVGKAPMPPTTTKKDAPLEC